MSEIIIDLKTPKGIILEKTAIPSEYTVSEIIHQLVEHLQLPFFNEGHTVEYSLKWMNQNSTLDPQQTLVEAGVSAGDLLQLMSSVPVPEAKPDPLPQPNQPSDRTIEVVLSVQDLNKSGHETLDLDLPVSELLKGIAKMYKLPDADELRVATVYSIGSKALGRLLLGHETLRSAKVPRLDRLTVTRANIAG